MWEELKTAGKILEFIFGVLDILSVFGSCFCLHFVEESFYFVVVVCPFADNSCGSLQFRFFCLWIVTLSRG